MRSNRALRSLVALPVLACCWFVPAGAVALLDGGEGEDALEGEAGSDNCLSGTTETSCEGSENAVTPRDALKAQVGMTEVAGYSQIYVVGSEGNDDLTATYTPSAVTVDLPGGGLDVQAAALSGCSVTAAEATCPLNLPLDSIEVAGMQGEGSIEASNFPDLVSVALTGGSGNDVLTGGEASEDVLVDGPGGGNDQLSALGGDDALLHNGGADQRAGGNGNDLFLSVSICDGDALEGGPGRDNASWARLEGRVEARLDLGRDGEPGAGGAPECSSGALDSLSGIEDLEGSNGADVLYGDGGPNQLLGHAGADTYFALGGEDSILANSGDDDAVIDCGEGVDSALITRHPPRLVLLGRHPRRVAFRFASTEAGSTFLCRLDSRPYRRCRSPRSYRVGRGEHLFRVVAIDSQQNRDRSPAIFRFRAKRR